MKRFVSTLLLCGSLLILLSLFLFPASHAEENPILALLNLPAPPPPNPEVTLPSTVYPENFFDKNNPPPDDTSIEALMDYWRAQAQDFNEIRHRVYPSDKVFGRILAELEKKPDDLGDFLNIFPRSNRAAEFVKGFYDKFASGTEMEREGRGRLREWLKRNTPLFSSELARDAARATDTDGYVTNHREVVTLARVDWDRAAPIVNRLYNSPGRGSRTAALWALYLHAIETSPGDTERYRDELKQTVEDKSLPDGIRDLALDALSLEKEWSGRDEWYLSLFEDETLIELGTYTGLTTLISASPDEKYVDRMLALLESDNINVRTAAARNLLLKLDAKRPDVIKALLRWLTDPKWLKPNFAGRERIVQALATTKVPEAVPALIAALDEKGERPSGALSNANANMGVMAPPPVWSANSAASMANMVANSYYGGSVNLYPLRYWAISALAFQEDPRAVPALRRLLAETAPPHEQSSLVRAIYSCGGYSIPEQVNALEDVAKTAETMGYGANSNAFANNLAYGIPNYSIYDRSGKPTVDVTRLLGIHLAQQYIVSDELARAAVDRIGSLERNDPKTANAMRKIVMQWYAPAVYSLLLRDLKNNRTEREALLRLLTVRKHLRETQQADVFEIRTGSPMALGISACLLEDPSDYDAILDGTSDAAKAAMLACARLIRAPLSLPKVAENLHGKDKLLALAAERYLESEDSPEARRIVLSLHPNEAKILGATTAFYPNSSGEGAPVLSLLSLLASVSPYHAQPQAFYGAFDEDDPAETEKRIQDAVKKDPEILGIYSWQENFIHVYKDRAVLSWDEDPARYRERALSKEEFANFKGLIAHYKADDLPPFLVCTQCASRRLLMVGRSGGRRVYVRASTLPPFFAELDRTFTDMRRQPAAIKYWAGKDVPGLQVLFADDRLEAKAVWKNGADFRLLTADKVRRQEIDSEIEALGESMVGDDDPGSAQNSIMTETSKREYENFGWLSFSGETLGSPVTQPVEVPYIPIKDSLPVAASEEQWKTRAGTVEIRADGEGLYKVAAGKLTKIKSGAYSEPVVTPNGRWAIATKFDDEVGGRLARVNLLTNREYIVQPGELYAYRAIAYVPSINRVLVGPYENEYGGHYHSEEGVQAEDDGSGYSWLDPETGALIAARGEVRPLVQQKVRPLQPAANPHEFWAAIANDRETVIGIYNSRVFTLKTVLSLPKITFNSMDIWVDDAASKAYIVYEGHLLAAPLKAQR